MLNDVWTSTGPVRPEVGDPGDRVALGGHWQLVGTTGTHPDKSLGAHIAHSMGSRSSTPAGPVEFYLAGDPDSPWVREMSTLSPGLPQRVDRSVEPARFWIAIALQSRGGPVLVGRAQAQVTTLRRRPDEPHPGLTGRPLLIPVRLRPSRGRAFDRHDPD